MSFTQDTAAAFENELCIYNTPNDYHINKASK